MGRADRRHRTRRPDHGFEPDVEFNRLRGHKGQIWWRHQRELHLDLFLGRFEMCHQLDLADRLDPDHPAMPAADLPLTKLQVVELNEKDVIDMARLLLSHEPAEADGPGLIGLPRLDAALAHDWGFFTSVTDNLQRLGPAFASLALPDADRRLATERAARIATHLQQLPKSHGFKVRARVGRRKRWYATPEESIPA